MFRIVLRLYLQSYLQLLQVPHRTYPEMCDGKSEKVGKSLVIIQLDPEHLLLTPRLPTRLWCTDQEPPLHPLRISIGRGGGIETGPNYDITVG